MVLVQSQTDTEKKLKKLEGPIRHYDTEVEGPSLGELGVRSAGAAVQSAIGYGSHYIAESAKEYANARDTIAQYANSGADFIKRFDAEVTPKYRNMLMISEAHGRVAKDAHMMAERIDHKERENAFKIDNALALNDVANYRLNSATFEDFNRKSEEAYTNLQDKYGKVSPSFVINFRKMVEDARNSYARGEMSKDMQKSAENLLRDKVLSRRGSPEETMEWLNKEYLPLYGNNEDLRKSALVTFIENSPTALWSEEFLAMNRDTLTQDETVFLNAKAENTEVRNQNIASTNFRNLQQMVDANLARGIPTARPTTQEQQERTQIALRYDLQRMSPEQIAKLDISPGYKRDLIENFTKAFKTDFLKASEQYIGAKFDPLTIPVYSPTMGITFWEEFLSSARERATEFAYTKSIYGETDAIQEAYTAPEKMAMQDFFSKVSPGEKLKAAQEIYKTTVDYRGRENALKDLGDLSGDIDLTSTMLLVSEGLNRPSPASAYMAYKNPTPEMKQRTMWTQEWLSQQKDTFTGASLLMDALDPNLLAAATMYGAGGGHNHTSHAMFKSYLGELFYVSSGRLNTADWMTRYRVGVADFVESFVSSPGVTSSLNLPPKPGQIPPRKNAQDAFIAINRNDFEAIRKKASTDTYRVGDKQNTINQILIKESAAFLTNENMSFKNFGLWYYDQDNVKQKYRDARGKHIIISIP